MATNFPRFTRGQLGRLTYADMNRVFDLLNQLEAEASQRGFVPTRIPHSTRWMARIDEIDDSTSPAHHAGHEVQRIGEFWQDVPNGRRMELDGSWDTIYGINRAAADNVPQVVTIGQVVEVEDRYDSEDVFVRDFYGVSGGGAAEVLVGAITESTLLPGQQPTYSAQSCNGQASVGPNESPIDRPLPQDLFDYVARQVGDPCLILQCFPPGGGPPSQWLVAFEHVMGTECPDTPGAAADAEGGDVPAPSATPRAADLYLAANYR